MFTKLNLCLNVYEVEGGIYPKAIRFAMANIKKII